MMTGQPAVRLAGAVEVDVQAARRGADNGLGRLQHSSPLEPVECLESVAVRVHIDIEHIGAWGSGGHRDIEHGALSPPSAYLPGVGGGVLESVRGSRFL